MTTEDGLRIGEFARRVEVSPELLRAWERRYGLLRPRRSPGGFRVYDGADAERVEQMRRGLAAGLSAAQAAQAALAPARVASTRPVEELRTRLYDALAGFDEPGASAVLDQAFAEFVLDVALRDVILPVLARIGDAWREGTLDVSQEHFASNVVRGRLTTLGRLWGRGNGPLAILACLPAERHDIGLLAFALLLRSHGVRILYLGADTPIETVRSAVASTSPAVVVLTTRDPGALGDARDDLLQLSAEARVVLGGPGVTEESSREVGATFLAGDVVAAADELARSL